MRFLNFLNCSQWKILTQTEIGAYLGNDQHLREGRVQRKLYHLPTKRGQVADIVKGTKDPQTVHRSNDCILTRKLGSVEWILGWLERYVGIARARLTEDKGAVLLLALRRRFKNFKYQEF